jgi:hypothetical protein
MLLSTQVVIEVQPGSEGPERRLLDRLAAKDLIMRTVTVLEARLLANDMKMKDRRMIWIPEPKCYSILKSDLTNIIGLLMLLRDYVKPISHMKRSMNSIFSDEGFRCSLKK